VTNIEYIDSNRKSAISVCIPTYQRPKFLEEAIHSVCAQTLLPIEILIGDDSLDNLTENLIVEIEKKCTAFVRYVHNSPPLGQAENVNLLYKMAGGDKIVLLHDDDLLLPNALEDLNNCWNLYPNLVAAYGKQYIISEDGVIDMKDSFNLNQLFFRTSDRAGLQNSSLEAALLHQFPNDCYMVLASAAKEIKWRSPEEVGTAVDFDFGLQLGFKYSNFFFLDKFTAKYRLTKASVSQNPYDNAAAKSFNIILNTSFPENLSWAKEYELKREAPIAMAQLINLGEKKLALDIYFSKYHPLSKRLSLGGIRRFIKALIPRSIGRLI
jgi:glycosyltransferase involved in cell wall biosynthesis